VESGTLMTISPTRSTLVLHNRICRDRGAEDDPFETADILLVDQFRRDCQKRCKEVIFVGQNFGFFRDSEVIDENRIGMSYPPHLCPRS